MLGNTKLKNNVRMSLHNPISDVDDEMIFKSLGGVSQGLSMPAPGESTDVILTIMDNDTTPTRMEIVKGKLANVSTIGLDPPDAVGLENVQRGLEGTTAQSWSQGAVCMQSLTAGMLTPSDISVSGDVLAKNVQATKSIHVGGATLSFDNSAGNEKLEINVQGGPAKGVVIYPDLSLGGSLYSLDIYAANISGDLQMDSTAAPVTSGAIGKKGDIRFSSTHLYVCVGTNHWKRIALVSF